LIIMLSTSELSASSRLDAVEEKIAAFMDWIRPAGKILNIP